MLRRLDGGFEGKIFEYNVWPIQIEKKIMKLFFNEIAILWEDEAWAERRALGVT